MGFGIWLKHHKNLKPQWKVFSSGEWPQVFLTQQTLEGLPHLPGLENGPGFDSQGSVNFFIKYCFPNLHRIHVKAFEVEDCEFVPVHHQPKVLLEKVMLCRTANLCSNQTHI